MVSLVAIRVNLVDCKDLHCTDTCQEFNNTRSTNVDSQRVQTCSAYMKRNNCPTLLNKSINCTAKLKLI